MPYLAQAARSKWFRDDARPATAERAAQAARGAPYYYPSISLTEKPDSLYSESEFDQVSLYLATRARPVRMEGVVYVKGSVLVLERQRILISRGALITEGTVYVSPHGVLEITHSADTRNLPGLVVLNDSPVTVSEGAKVRVHGILFATKTIGVNAGARVDIVGAILAGDGDFSFRNSGGIVTIRYDHAILGTPGLLLPKGVTPVAWVAAWEDIP